MIGNVIPVMLEHRELLEELYLMASEIVEDFEDYGPVLQANEDGVYDEKTTIRRLQAVRNEILRLNHKLCSGPLEA